MHLELGGDVPRGPARLVGLDDGDLDLDGDGGFSGHAPPPSSTPLVQLDPATESLPPAFNLPDVDRYMGRPGALRALLPRQPARRRPLWEQLELTTVQIGRAHV